MRKALRIPPGVWLMLFFGFYLSLTCLRAWHKPFWHDEILTLAIADLRGLLQMWKAELMGFDFNPPLNCILTKASMSVPGKLELTARFPPIAGYLILLLSLCLFIGRRLPVHFALPAMSFALLSGAYEYSFEARAYSLVAACAGVALVSWQVAVEDGASRLKRRLALVLLAIALSGALLAHCFAVLVYLPICAGEAWRTRTRRRVDVAVWAALIAALIPLALYPALFAANRNVIRPDFFRATPRRLAGAYAMLIRPLTIPLAILVIALGFYAYRKSSEVVKLGGDLVRRVPAHEGVAVIASALIPLCGWAIAAVLHSGYVPRYGLAGVIGLAILFAYGVYVLSAARPAWPQWIAASSLIWFVVLFASNAREWSKQTPSGDANEASVIAAAATGRPVVISNGLEFLPLAYYLAPEAAKQIVFLADEELALRNTGTDLIDSGLWRARSLLPIRGRIEAYRDFTQRNQRFWLFSLSSRSEEWTFRQLQSDGAVLKPARMNHMYDVLTKPGSVLTSIPKPVPGPQLP